MHVIECRGSGDPSCLHPAERPLPQLKNGEILIKIAAAGLNRADILQRQGLYPPPSDAVADILGMEVAGEVVAVGTNVQRWKIGDSVCALLSGGGYAEFAGVSADHCLPVPDGLSFIEAASLPECIITVWANLFEAGKLKSGQTVLVHGGTSGIGIFAIQMTKAAGAKIIATAGSEEKCQACLELGADYAINYKTEDFTKAIERITQKTGIDVVLDMIGGEYVQRNLSILAQGGHHISIAIQGGKMASVDLWHMMRQRLVLTGSTLRHRSRPEKARLVKEVEKSVWPWLAQKKIKPLIYKAYSINEVVSAHKMMASGLHIGKIVLEVAF